MEGMLASAVLKLAAAKLASAIGDQVMMQWKLKDNLEDMKDTMESMAAVLKDAERRSIRKEEESVAVLLWLKRLKSAAYDISDMLDDFQDGKRTGLLSYVPNAAKNIGLANRMKKMKQQLRKIKEDHERFQFSRDSGGTIEQQITDPRETISAPAVNEDVVGREEEKKNIVELLLERNSKEETIIVPIHGLGGIGKTTLARLVFNDTQFKEYDHRVWVYVSQVFDLKKIGNTIISRVSKQRSHDLFDLESIYQRLKELLNGQKCLIVLDDLWEEEDTELDKLKNMLNVGKAGSKIDVIVTTRKYEEIAKKIQADKSYDLKPLDDTMCWSIIKKRCNFESGTDKEQLEQIGQDIANKCAGMALAAQALGYMLSGMNLEECSAMRDNYIWSECSSEDTSFPLPSLMLSYKSMPSYLKLCFAYCAIFPKGQDIRKYDLIHQWIALDFIEPSKTFSAIQLGEKYVRQLLGMSFLRHSDLSSHLSSTSQKPALFTMHDLVHDLATSVMADELLVSDAKNESNSSRNKYCRYALLTNYSGSTKLSAIFPAKVRALRFLGCWDLELRNDALSFAKYLRVLDLRGYPFSKLPKCVTQLSRLQYLNISTCWRLDFIPESLGNLKTLHTLDISHCYKLHSIPESLGNLKTLHTLDISLCFELHSIPEGLGNLKTLHTLDISRCYELHSIPKSLGNLKTLHTLDISHCSRLDSIPESLGNLKTLHTLDISYCRELHSIPESLGNLKTLHTLDISHCRELHSIPESLGNLKTLHTLDISGYSRLDSIPESIGAIPTLKFIKVEDCSIRLKVHMTHSPLLSKFVKSAFFIVHANDVNTFGNLHMLEDVNYAELKICSLENVRFLEEARRVKLFEKQNLSKLTFDWALDACRLLEDKDVLEELVPPRVLKHLKLRGYSSIELPTWLMGIISSPPYLDVSHHLPNLVKIKLENLPRCNSLPPLGQLPNLEELQLIGLCSITKIGEDLCGGGGAFRRLSTFTLKNMERLEEWSTTYNGVEFMFPKLLSLWTLDCPSLRLKPCPPIFYGWYIRSSDKVISSWGEGGHISVSSSTPANWLNVKYSKVPMDKWRLLRHIPTLQKLELSECDYLASLPKSMRRLVSLRSLQLSFCRSISMLPEWIGDLTSLESLEITACQSMKSLPQCVQQLTKLKELKIWANYELKNWCESEENKIKLAHIKEISLEYCDYSRYDDRPKNHSVLLQLFMVSDVNTCSKLQQLEDINIEELKIYCLENVRSLEEACKIKLLERQSLSKLTLEWTSDEERFLEEKDVLGELVPPRGLQHLELDGYSCISFPIWLMGISHYLPNLIEIKLENLPRCSDLPPLGQLPNLDKLHLKRLKSMTKIGRDFCAREGAFLRLSEFALYDMEQLEEWNTTYCREDGVEEFMFPKLDKLDIGDCPKLRLTPRPPIFCIWEIWNSDMVISSWSEVDHISHSPSDTPGTTLEVSFSKVPVGEWRLLHHLPTLQVLIIKKCDKLMSLPENMQHLASLQSLILNGCNGISTLPEWLGHLTSLERLIIYSCDKLTSLPENIQHLASLQLLYLNDCNGISVLPEWLGHLTSLERLTILGCRSIKSLPQCIQQLTKLKELQILCNPELEKWCESDENKMKLAHIENIFLPLDDDDLECN